MSVISSRDMMAATASSRPGSRASEMRPIFLLERCLAIRFERIPTVLAAATTTAPSSVVSTKNNNKSSADSRPGSSLSQQFSTWLPWQRHHQQSNNKQPEAPAPPPPPPTTDNSPSPSAWLYDGGFLLYQVNKKKEFHLFCFCLFHICMI